MKHSNFLKNKLAISVMLIMVTIGLTSMKPATAYDPSGTWDYEVETNEGTMSDKLTISKEDGKYEISIETTQFGTLELDDIVLSENELSANVDMQGAIIEFEFEFDGDSMEGKVKTPDGELTMTAKRRKE